MERSLDAFRAVQGTACIPDGSGGCQQFQGPQPNLIGIEDNQQHRCGIIDYAGVIDRWLQDNSGRAISLGTTVTGKVKERTLPDGSAEIRVPLVTTNALIWSVASCDAANPNEFGYTAQEVLAGATPSLGDATFVTKYIVPAPGLPLNDILQIFLFPEAGEDVAGIRLDADAHGALRAAFGVPDGTPGTVSMKERLDFDRNRPIIKGQIDLSVD